jgi:hypothetical protein
MTVKFTRILKMIEFQRLDISAELIPTYCALADYSNKKGYCWPKMETLAKTLKCSVRTIQRHIKELAEKGLNAWCELFAEDLSGRCPPLKVGLLPDPERKGTDSSCSAWTPSSPHSTLSSMTSARVPCVKKEPRP